MRGEEIVRIGFEVLTAENKMSVNVWNVTPCRSTGFCRRCAQTSVEVLQQHLEGVTTNTINASNYECLRTLFSGNQYLRGMK
jgi:hypothetical protein